jgi:hypothetical protein
VLDVEGEPAAPVTAQVDAGEVDRRGDQQERRERPDRLPVGDDDVVDNPALNEGNGGGRQGSEQRAAQCDADVAAVSPAVTRQPS